MEGALRLGERLEGVTEGGQWVTEGGGGVTGGSG